MTQEHALDILKTGANVFLTGEPGAGKTYTINKFVEYLRSHGIEPAITASTGIAATHIQGMTIHSWSGIGIKSYLSPYDIDVLTQSAPLSKRVKGTQVLIIDEISMLSADTFSMVDQVCKAIRHDERPFGGLQVVCVGDFFQLPPVSRGTGNSDGKNFAFMSSSWQELGCIVCYLKTQHRQDDTAFLSILSAIRSNSFDRTKSGAHMKYLEERYISRDSLPKDITKLYSHNFNVDDINGKELAHLNTPEQIFEMTSQGRPSLVVSLKKNCVSPEKLVLKVGAIVMFTKNSPMGVFANGTLGKVIGFNGNGGNPIVQLSSSRKITVEPMDWSIEEQGSVKAKITQLPLRLAWAITVHKSQGMSLDSAIMDLSASFEFGQGYVALSRVKNLAGLYLLGWNDRAFQVHPDILRKDKEFRSVSAEAEKEFALLSSEELTNMHHNFIRASGGAIDVTHVAKKTGKKLGKKVDKTPGQTYRDTLAIFNEGKTIDEIAKVRGLTFGTILQHLEKLIGAGDMKGKDVLERCDTKTQEDIRLIHKAFVKLKSETLSTLFNYFKGQYSYDLIRLARMVYEQ